MKLLEKDIQQTCAQWLELDGWRRLRTSPVSNRARATGFGEPGMADDLFLRYWRKREWQPHDSRFNAAHIASGNEIMWIEWKRESAGKGNKALFTKAEKAKIHQRAWHAAERARGALTLIAGEDFPATISGFEKWYRESGLMQRRLS